VLQCSSNNSDDTALKDLRASVAGSRRARKVGRVGHHVTESGQQGVHRKEQGEQGTMSLKKGELQLTGGGEDQWLRHGPL
jgi:hypothetical protein